MNTLCFIAFLKLPVADAYLIRALDKREYLMRKINIKYETVQMRGDNICFL